ncbi:hypothetical protein [Pedobacter boryungensis]|uniref:SPOR domain-containing protein n=1 Tax=Pedobacter boryungensis TaxID=869962 RepID=A0ABX2DCP8_9SPHI|nr:hypothetical protein [Pedobacter boryungensis]NQX31582.1 hypothetical protein [Pedobacter boryungensis]
MEKYYVNKKAQSNGDHEVHVKSCTWFPSSENAMLLGEFSSCADAVKEAKKTYSKANGCWTCCRPCHTT